MSGRPFGYSIQDYGGMVACEPRMSAYAEALRHCVRPRSTVFDIGSGPGVFALIACQLGAAKAVAIEPDSSVELARRFAADNGFADRFEVFQGVSTDYRPDRRADVIVSDIRGNLPFLQGNVATIVDARARLLAPDGTLIPRADHLYIAAVTSPATFAKIAVPWRDNRLDLDLSAGFDFAANTAEKAWFERADLLSDPARMAIIDYTKVVEANCSTDFRLKIVRSGIIHGFALWFDAELAEGIGFSNAPGTPKLIYGQMFLPLATPVEIKPGGTVSGHFDASLIGREYVYSWSGQIVPTAGAGPVRFHQTTFRSRIYSPGDLRNVSAETIPSPNDDLIIDRFILGQIDGTSSVEAIAMATFEQFKTCIPTLGTAIDRVLATTARYQEPRQADD